VPPRRNTHGATTTTTRRESSPLHAQRTGVCVCRRVETLTAPLPPPPAVRAARSTLNAQVCVCAKLWCKNQRLVRKGYDNNCLHIVMECLISQDSREFELIKPSPPFGWVAPFGVRLAPSLSPRQAGSQ
jgi:hypothetical protein